MQLETTFVERMAAAVGAFAFSMMIFVGYFATPEIQAAQALIV